VAQGFCQILHTRAEELARQFDVRYTITAVCDLLKGSVYHPQGLRPGDLLEAVQKKDSLAGVAAQQRGWDALQTIRQSNADTIVETSYTDLKTGQPAISHVEAALQAGKHVVTTNKGPVALRYQALAELARQHGVTLGVEGTVMSGTPAVHLGLGYLKAAGVCCVQGILNGTTNYILTKMSSGAPYSSALEEAQELGYAEADPTGDVEGFDAAGKVVILANLLMGASLTMDDVDRQGITVLSLDDISAAAQAGERWKLIGKVEVLDGAVKASVKPTRLPLSHPLAGVSGATNAITYTTDLLGDVTLIGPGAGRLETGYAVLADLLAIR